MRTRSSSKPAPYVLSPRTASTESASHLGPASGGRQAGWRLRLAVRLTRPRLDREILAGPRRSSPALNLRVEQLTGRRSREQFACRLRGVLRQADERSSQPVISAVVLSPRAVRAGRGAILALAERLEGRAPVDPRGIVLAQRLLTDGVGPMFNPYSEQTVTEAVQQVTRALDAGIVPTQDTAPTAIAQEQPATPELSI